MINRHPFWCDCSTISCIFVFPSSCYSTMPYISLLPQDKKTKHSHATSSDNTPSIDLLHVTEAASSGHVTSTNDHVTSTNDHVTSTNGHVTSTNGHVTLGNGHVTGSPSKTLAVPAPSPSSNPTTSPTSSTLFPPMVSRQRPRHSRSSSSTKLPTTPEETTRPSSISLSVPKAGEGSLRSPSIGAASDLSASLPNGMVQVRKSCTIAL